MCRLVNTSAVLAAGLMLGGSAQAQLLNPDSVAGTFLGGITGAIIGHNSGRHAGQGAAIGAGAGFVLGNLVHHSRPEPVYYAADPYPAGYSVSYSSYPATISYSYSSGYTYVYSAPGVVAYAPPPPPAVVYQSRPNYAVSGTIMGGVAGAIIGSASRGHHTAEGALIGAGAGLVLGSVAEHQARTHPRVYVAVPAGPPVYVAPPPAPAYVPPPPAPAYAPPAVQVPAPASAPERYPAIPDAPTVNDAPTVPDAPQASVFQPAVVRVAAAR